jgi:hypothetical protein
VRPVGVDHGHGRLACLSLRARATSRRGGFQAARPHAGGGGAWSGKGAGMVEKERRKIGVETRAASTVRGGCARPVRQAAPVARATTEVGSKRNTQWPKPNEAAGAGPRAVTHCRGTRWPFPALYSRHDDETLCLAACPIEQPNTEPTPPQVRY